ncbi:MAG: DsbA family protein [Myxococcota bacterium]
MSRGSAIIAIVLSFVGGLLIGHITGSSTGGDGGAEDAEIDAAAAAEAAGDVERFKVPVTGDQPQKGPDDAVVTIVEWSDFQCPFCSRVGPTVDRIMKEYGDKVRIVWRNNPLPFHKEAMPAAVAAMEAYEQGGDEKFWEMHDLLFENQKKLKRPDLEKYAKQIGLDMGEFKKALDDNEHADQVKKDQEIASGFGARGTPAFFINGRKLMGAQPYDKFKEIIDDEVQRAETLVGTGVPKSRVYAAMMKNAKTEATPDEPEKQKKRVPDPDAVYKVPVSNEPQRGPSNALVTVVTFSDFQCPFCSRVEGTLDQVVDKYGDDVRIVWMNNPLPFHKEATPAAILALEAYEQGGNDKFWKVHELLFENQKKLDRASLESYAKQVGLNMAQVKRALDNQEHKDTIEKQQQLAKSLGATGTPAFFINGRYIRGAQPLPAFQKVIDEELPKAKKKVEGGVSRARLYDELIKNGATSAQFIEQDAPAKDEKADKPDPDKVYDITLPNDAPTKGPRNAKVVIQEFSDFQCPFCSRVLPTLEKVVESYGDKVKLVWGNFPLPFHQQAMPAHQAAMEVHRQAGSDAFWKYHDILFENQKQLTRENLEKWAQELGGINMAEFKKALDQNRHKGRIESDMEAVKKAGARIGTPSFFINGKLLQGAQPYNAFENAIKEALNEG